MQGKVLSFDPDNFDSEKYAGTILGCDDQKVYNYEASEWNEDAAPQVGQLVEFTPDGDEATDICNWEDA